MFIVFKNNYKYPNIIVNKYFNKLNYIKNTDYMINENL